MMSTTMSEQKWWKCIQNKIKHSVPGKSINAKDNIQYTQRRLKLRHIQFIGIGGTIGTTLFVQIGRGLLDGGPASLLLAFMLWSTFVLAITVSLAEMVSLNPISSPFIRFAGRYVNDAFGTATGWNYFALEVISIPFEIVACNIIIKFWDKSDTLPVGATIAVVLILYALINLYGVRLFGEVEFWTSLFKIFLVFFLTAFSFVVMLGGNPLHDKFGFRYWRKPGAFAEFYSKGSLAKFLGFLQCFILASYTIAGPEYVAITAGEAENPRINMPKAFKSVFYRLTCFFIVGSLSVGVLVAHNDPELIRAYAESKPGASSSPYVIAMRRLKIHALPDLVNAMILTSAFSAGNSFVYCASRSLYGLSLDGKAPAFFSYCNKNGVPVYSVVAVLTISLVAFLQVSNRSSVVLQWFVNMVTTSQLINFAVICWTYLRFHRACCVQKIDRSKFPFQSWGQPFTAWYGFVGSFVMIFMGGYAVFLPHRWKVSNFLFSYTMVATFPVVYLVRRIVSGESIRKAEDIDIFRDIHEIEEYEESLNGKWKLEKIIKTDEGKMAMS